MSTILNAAGKPITLTEKEQRIANQNQRIVNALGYEVNITTLTTIVKKVTEQKFFEIAPADYMPIRVGEGAWSSNLVTYRSYQLSDDFSTGVINTGGNSARLAVGDAGRPDSARVQLRGRGGLRQQGGVGGELGHVDRGEVGREEVRLVGEGRGEGLFRAEDLRRRVDFRTSARADEYRLPLPRRRAAALGRAHRRHRAGAVPPRQLRGDRREIGRAHV